MAECLGVFIDWQWFVTPSSVGSLSYVFTLPRRRLDLASSVESLAAKVQRFLLMMDLILLGASTVPIHAPLIQVQDHKIQSHEIPKHRL